MPKIANVIVQQRGVGISISMMMFLTPLPMNFFVISDPIFFKDDLLFKPKKFNMTPRHVIKMDVYPTYHTYTIIIRSPRAFILINRSPRLLIFYVKAKILSSKSQSVIYSSKNIWASNYST